MLYITKDFYIIFRKINFYVKNYDGNKYLSLIPSNGKDKDVLEKYEKI